MSQRTTYTNQSKICRLPLVLIDQRRAALTRWRRRRRSLRRAVLAREDPRVSHSVVGEAALSRLAGGLVVMRVQLARVAELASLPDVKLRVIPIAVGTRSGKNRIREELRGS
jgi:Domain of unknown function (DUF5753)